MRLGTTYQLGGTLLVYLITVSFVYTISETTYENEIPESYANISGGNTLWNSLIRECKQPTFTCIQNNMYVYLKNILDYTKSYEIKELLKITPNNVQYETLNMDNTEINNEDAVQRSLLEEVTESLRNKAIKFMMTHDLQLTLPDILFDGNIVKVSPRSFEDGGVLTRLELLPKLTNENSQNPRLFKKIRKFIGEKLIHALLAIILVVALLAVKFLFFLPLILGVAAAKKLLIKVLLFFFPFLAHFFKLCPYYDANGLTKFHHHHHSVAHLHHLPHQPHLHTNKHHPYGHDDHSTYYDSGLDYYSEGPGLTSDFINHRKTDQRHIAGDEGAIHSWSAGQGQENGKRPRQPQLNRPLSTAEIENLAENAERQALIKLRLQQEHQRVQAENKLLQEQIRQSLRLQEKLRLQSTITQKQHPKKADPTYFRSNFTPASNKFGMGAPSPPIQTHITSQALPLQSPNPEIHTAIHQAAAITYDAFYSPILDKIDSILSGIGYNEEPCRERLICSMYKNPTKFSPHSNLISAELSRDASELQKPTATNSAVIRFYRYVQAARDGQDKRECLRLYPTCGINTDL